MTEAQQELVSAEEAFPAQAEALRGRLAVVQERHGDYHGGVLSRRFLGEEIANAGRRIKAAGFFLFGDYDSTYPGQSRGESLSHWRERWCADALLSAELAVAWAEHYAGLRGREDVRGEQERLYGEMALLKES